MGLWTCRQAFIKLGFYRGKRVFSFPSLSFRCYMETNSGTAFFPGLNAQMPLIFDFLVLSFFELHCAVTLPKTQHIPKQMSHGL